MKNKSNPSKILIAAFAVLSLQTLIPVAALAQPPTNQSERPWYLQSQDPWQTKAWECSAFCAIPGKSWILVTGTNPNNPNTAFEVIKSKCTGGELHSTAAIQTRTQIVYPLAVPKTDCDFRNLYLGESL